MTAAAPRNKKSIAIDLHKPEGVEVARKLAASADVVAENFKPGTMVKYGLDYAALSQANPRLIYKGNTIAVSTPEDAASYFRSELQKYAGLVKKAGVEPQ